jgi:hypothetical protein
MRQYSRIPHISALIAVALISLLAACGSTPSTTATAVTKKSSTSSIPLKVIGVDINLSVPTVSTYTCGTQITETYTATFHFPANNAGGQVTFGYTTNNGRSTHPATLVVSAGQTSATYAFSWSGQTSQDNTVPGPGGVQVTAPNAYTSKLVAPSGTCIPASSTPTTTTPFKVTSVGLTASPEVTGHRCGSPFTESYTATFHIAPGGPGGTIVFQYTMNNGRSSSSNVSLHVAAGQTSATYTFTWSGSLPEDHTAPGIGGVMVSAPNQIASSLVTPEGGCSTM